MNVELDALEYAVLEQTYRFGLGLPEMAAFVVRLRNAKVTAHDLLDSLAAKGYLGQAPLYGNRRYYFLDDRAHQEFDLDKSDMGPLKEREKVYRYAMLRLCLESNPPRRPLTRSDFKYHFPQLFDARPRGRQNSRKQQPRFRSYYLAGSRLGLLRVDFGGNGRYDRILAAVYRQFRTHQSMPPYAELITRDAFELAIVTAFRTKARRLMVDLANGTTDTPITVHAVPEMREFIAPPEEP